ncbi:hypothetical protein MY10362_005625 [Beauveria mimosiformis]
MPSLVSCLLAGLAVVDRAAAAKYSLSQTYDSTNFLKEFHFRETGTLPDRQDDNWAWVKYQNVKDAEEKGIASVKDNKVYLGVDHETKLKNDEAGPRRDTLRVQSKWSFREGLVITRFYHMPKPVCGAWPAYWTLGENWPLNGEIDMYEGWNLHAVNKPAIHTGPKRVVGQCYLDSSASAKIVSEDCDNEFQNNRNAWRGQGCQVEEVKDGIWGASDGGIQALEWTKDTIKLYTWPTGKEPENIDSKTPDTSSWGTPSVQLSSPGCDTSKAFGNQTILFTLPFCGDPPGNNQFWTQLPADSKGGQTCKQITGADTCIKYVAENPEAFKDFYFGINDVRLFFQDAEDSEGDKKDTEGDKKDSEGDKKDTEGDKKDSEGDKKDTEGDKKDSEGDKKDSEGDKKDTDGDKKDSEGDKKDIEGDKKDSEGDNKNTEGDNKNTKSQLSLDSSSSSALTFKYATSQSSSDNWIGVWPEDDTQAPTWGSTTWKYAKESSGSLKLTPPSSMKAGKYKAYLLSGDRKILAFLSTFDYKPESSDSSDSKNDVAFTVKTHYNVNCGGSANNHVDIKPGSNGVCVRTNCDVGSLEIPSVGSCPNGQVRISYWQNADCGGDWYGYGYGSRGTCRGLWSNGWAFKSLWISCADRASDCIQQGTCTAAPEPATEICRAGAADTTTTNNNKPDAGADKKKTTDNSAAFHLKTRYSGSCTGAVHNDVTVPHGNGQCIDTGCAVGSLDIDSVGNCPDGEVRISYWDQPGCRGKWFGYGYASRNTCRTLWSGGWNFKSLWVSCAKKSDDCVSRGTCTIDNVSGSNVC